MSFDRPLPTRKTAVDWKRAYFCKIHTSTTRQFEEPTKKICHLLHILLCHVARGNKAFFYPTQHFWMLFEKKSFSLNKSCFYAWLVIDSRQLKWAYNLFSKSSWFTACGSLVIDNLTKSLEIVLLVKCIIKSYYPKTSFCTANHYNQFGRK